MAGRLLIALQVGFRGLARPNLSQSGWYASPSGLAITTV